MSKLIEGKKRYTNGYMIYGCDNCGQGFRMYLEESLENGGSSQKPVPFSIKCPFCGDMSRDVSFGKIKVPRQLIKTYMPAFIDIEGDDCGKPIHVNLAKPEFTKAKSNKEEQ